VAGGAEAFRNLAGLIGRIEKSVADMARLTVAASRVQDRAGIASGLRGQLQSAVTSPAMMRGLTEVLSQKLGGEATGEIKESVKRYNAAIRRVIQARDRETEATQQVSKLTVQRANIFQQSMPNLYRALLAGTATPQQMAAAQIFGGARFTNLTQRIQQAQQTTTQQAGIGMQQQQVARVWAQRGQQAALGPGGIPQAGGFLAGAGSAITAAGLGGMGTIAGSLFGHKGAAIGFIFDAAIGAVTRAFNELNKAVVGASRVIDRLSVWSFGGMRAAIMLMIAELHKEIQMSRELGKDMLAFGMAQKENIKAWTGFDIFIERLKLQLGELGAQIQTFIGNTLSSFVENTGLKEHPLRVGLPLAGAGIGAAWGGVAGFAAGGPLGGLAGAGAGALAGGGIGMVMVLGMKIYDLLKEWFGWDQGKDKGKEPVDTDPVGAGLQFRQRGLEGKSCPWAAQCP
jgi:hypothetical protein